MKFKRLLLFLVAPLALMMTSCVDNGPEYSLPSIAITDAAGKDVTTVNFPAEGGELKFSIAATRSWNIGYSSDWFAVNPSSDTNEAMSAKVVEVTITAGANDGEARNETITLTMDKTEKKILISQSGKGQVELGEVLYYENFDKDGQQAQKVDDRWSTYLDSEAGQAFLNPTPESQANVTYAGQSVSVRSNSSNGSAGTHSNCSDVASGLNYIWFGSAPTYMTVSGISLAELEGNALTLSFTTERYEYEAEDNTYKNDEFKVYISADGAKWSEVSYTFLSGVDLNGKWNIATSQFNLKEVPETLSLYFTASVGSAYAIDDIKLTAGGGGVEIDLAQGGEIGAGGNGGGFTPSGEFIYFDNFDKTVAVQDKDKSWPYLTAEYGNPMPESQTGVTYNSHGVTARNNSNSDGKYSDIAEASGLNNVFFGKENYLTISGISLAELTGNALTITFAGDKYQQTGDSNFSTEEFKVYISGDGEKWTLLPYTFAGTTEGRWNTATAQFTLKEVPATLSFYFTATVASAYRLDDLMVVAGGTGAELDLSQGITIENAGGGDQGGTEFDPNAQQISVAEFIEKADTATTYQLTGVISGNVNTQYGNFDLVDETGSIYIYGLIDSTGANVNWSSKGLNAGDTVTIQGKYYLYESSNGSSKHEIVDALYISHVDGEGGDTPEPPVAEGAYASDAAFVCSTDDSTNAAYGLGATTINGSAVTGFKLGKSKQEGKFTSAAIGVSGDLYLNFYAVSWGAGGDKTIYFRVNGGEVMSQAIKANAGATGNHPYNNLTPTENDHYSVKLTGLNANDTIEFSTNADFALNTYSGTAPDIAPRVIVFGVKLTEEALGGEAGGNTGGGEEPEQPEQPGDVVKATVAEFLAAAEDATVYELTGTIKGTYNTYYGNFYLEDATGEVLIYGILKNGEKCYEALGLKDGDTITVQGARASYNGTAQMKNAEYISHTAGQGGTTPDTPEPPVAEGAYASDAAFVCSADNSTNAAYTLGATTINGNAVTGFKLGKSKQEGKFTSAAIGVSGDLYLNFYAVAWKGTTATLYWRVNGGEVMSQAIAGNAGATSNPPYSALAPTENDHYSVKLTGLNANDTIEFSTNADFALNTYSGQAPDIAPRVLVFGMKLTGDATGGESGGTTPEPEQPENPDTPEPEEPETPETPTEIAEISVAEFLNKSVDANVWYKLTGTIKNLANTTFGNFDLVDETGSVYVYGLTKTQVSDNDKSFSSIGLKEGDIVTLIGTRAEYNGSAQIGGPAYYVSHIEGEVPEAPENMVSISFADVANRTSFSTTQQVWEQNGITVTNDKGSSTNDVADYSGPVRFYKGSNLTIEAEKEMSQIVVNTTGGSKYYLTLNSGEGYTVEGSATANTTITLTTPATSFTITGLANQVRCASIDVIYAE